MKLPGWLVVIVLFGGYALLSESAYRLPEWQQAIITQFGEPVGEAVTEPGLHFKLPFVQKTHLFEKRWLEWDGIEVEMPTQEKTYIYVDTFARWRIIDPLKFYTSVGDETGAQSRLDAIIDSETRNVVAAYNLLEVVRTTNRKFKQVRSFDVANEAEESQEAVAVEEVKAGRDKLTRIILEAAAKEMGDYGIELVDIQFQRVNYTESVKRKAFERMTSERKSIAARYRSEGEGKSAEIRGKKQLKLKEIESEAYLKVQRIKGTADALATDIYAEAYNRDPNLYRLVKSLESYGQTIDEESWVVLSSDSDYFKQLVNLKVR